MRQVERTAAAQRRADFEALERAREVSAQIEETLRISRRVRRDAVRKLRRAGKIA